MPLPWLRLMDGVIGATDVVRWMRSRATRGGPEPAKGAIEQRLAGVVVGALHEAFDRDRERLEIERRQLDEERVRAERVLRLERLRQAGDREVRRLQLLSAVALLSLLSVLFLATQIAGRAGVRLALAAGCLLLILALAAAFAGQSAVGRVLARGNDRSPAEDVTMTSGGIAAPWLIVAGLAAVALGILLA